MKILFVSGHYPPFTKGGGEISTHLIAKGLIALGHDLTVITDLRRDSISQYEGVNVVGLPLNLTGKPLLERRSARRSLDIINEHLKDNQYDIIHAHDFRAGLALSDLNHSRLFVTARDYAQLSGCTNNITFNGNIDPGCQGLREAVNCHRIRETSWVRRPFRAWQYLYNMPQRRQAFSKFPAQIFISHSQQEYINSFQAPGRQLQKVVYNPVADSYLKQDLHPGVQGSVLYAGRIEMYKGVELLIRSWEEVIKAAPHAHLKLVGQGAQRNFYSTLVKQLNLTESVSFIDHVLYENMINLYEEAQVVVTPHLWVEPFGRTAAEALSLGKILVSANTGGPMEMIEESSSGLLFNRGQVTSLTEQLIKAINMNDQETSAMGMRGRAWAIDNLGASTIANLYHQVYQAA